jgi:hypothetical protein
VLHDAVAKVDAIGGRWSDEALLRAVLLHNDVQMIG